MGAFSHEDGIMEISEIIQMVVPLGATVIYVFLAIGRYKREQTVREVAQEEKANTKLDTVKQELKNLHMKQDQEQSSKIERMGNEIHGMQIKMASDYYRKQEIDTMVDRITNQINRGFERLERHIDDLREVDRKPKGE